MLEKTLESPWTSRRSSQPILKEISPEYSLEGLMLKVKLPNTSVTWWEELTHWKRPWCWERLKAGGKGDDRGWDGWMASLTQRIWVWVDSGSWWWTGRPGVLQFMGSQRVGHDWATELKLLSRFTLSFLVSLTLLPSYTYRTFFLYYFFNFKEAESWYQKEF